MPPPLPLPLPVLFLVIFLILLSLLPHSSIHAKYIECPPAFGYIHPNSTRCQRCPPGTYNDDQWHAPFRATRTSCRNCDANTYTPSWSGVATHSLCTRCPPNTASRPGSVRCTRCVNGTSPMLSGRCMRCPPGTQKGNDECWPCASHRVSPRANMENCDDCPKGTRANKQQSKCMPVRKCRSGTEFDPLYNSCRPCYGNTVRTKKKNGSLKCRPCRGRGIAQTKKGMPKTVCRLCPAGTFIDYSRNWRFRFGFAFSCSPCPTGTTTRGKGKRGCRHKLSGKCTGKTMFIDYQGDCDSCDIGFRYSKQRKRCIKCPPMSTSSGGLSTHCIKCGAGEMVLAARCVCSKGSVRRKRDGECMKCRRGSFYTMRDAEFGNDFLPRCNTCSTDSYSNTLGSMRCKPCPVGSSSWVTKGRRCVKWPKCEGSGWFIQDIQLNDWTREGRCVSRTTGCPRGLRARNSHWGGVQCVNDKGNLVCPKGMFVSNKYVEKSCESNEYIPYR